MPPNESEATLEQPVTPPLRVASRAELARGLADRGLDPDRLLDGYREWRLAHGYLEADPVSGIHAGESPAAQYRAMDPELRKTLADAGDLGALQAQAEASLPRDPFTALDAYGKASRLGSAGAMEQIAAIYASGNESLRKATPDDDLRQQAAAWALAAIRQYGPAVATDRLLGIAAYLEEADPAVVAAACARSLAIMVDINVATSTSGRPSGNGQPPVFLTEPDLYDRLPCRDTPAPVTPPRGLADCKATPAVGAGDRPMELWVCDGG